MKMKRATKTEEAPFSGNPMLEQIRRAWAQLDREPGQALGWLVNTFTREDPSGWLPGEQEAHSYRLLALIYGRQAPIMVRLGGGDIPPITPADVASVHAELRVFFRELVTGPAGKKVRVPTDGLQVAIMRATNPGEKPALFVKTNPGGPRRTILFQVVADLIAQTATVSVTKEGPVVVAQGRLVACKQCGDPMLALRKAVFCQAPCLQKWHDARRDKSGQRPKKKGSR